MDREIIAEGEGAERPGWFRGLVGHVLFHGGGLARTVGNFAQLTGGWVLAPANHVDMAPWEVNQLDLARWDAMGAGGAAQGGGVEQEEPADGREGGEEGREGAVEEEPVQELVGEAHGQGGAGGDDVVGEPGVRPDDNDVWRDWEQLRALLRRSLAWMALRSLSDVAILYVVLTLVLVGGQFSTPFKFAGNVNGFLHNQGNDLGNTGKAVVQPHRYNLPWRRDSFVGDSGKVLHMGIETEVIVHPPKTQQKAVKDDDLESPPGSKWSLFPKLSDVKAIYAPARARGDADGETSGVSTGRRGKSSLRGTNERHRAGGDSTTAKNQSGPGSTEGGASSRSRLERWLDSINTWCDEHAEEADLFLSRPGVD